ncbi:MAG: Urease accessory protein UreD [Candidatus Tokpelaia hoelldobleri]|uniref:Urease accessory protein UreD n=1 Tax=Candidatus Tokpelaia hoelldobleri TaxID=1902579 RepID=A0A1U9JTM9_9HYPH|nr:MAG: Urease accessory protein UreD [Candidatus Tokpelaia hoelldoblerii]
MQRMDGRAVVSVCHRDDQTGLERLFQQGAAKLLFPQGSGNQFEIVMINTAGGMTGGDSLEWEITSGANTSVVVTTQAAEKIYRALDDTLAQIKVHLRVEEKARLCWLPQETILFDCSACMRRLEVDMAEDAELLLCETTVLGRQVMGEKITRAVFRDNWVVRRNNQIIHAEALHLGPDVEKEMIAAALLNGCGAMASVLLVASDCERFLSRAREIIGPGGGISSWEGKLLARLFDRDGYSLRKRLVALIQLLNGVGGTPEIWSI